MESVVLTVLLATFQTKHGEEWDGNVPTNHKIKEKGTGEEKNLGRWVNRQRSAKQNGKLRKDREEVSTFCLFWRKSRHDFVHHSHLVSLLRQCIGEQQLEAAGLRWSVLTTASWDDMYKELCDYIKERKDGGPNNAWDGNVPAHYKTKDDPPRALGRWVNRQRSNYAKKKIKKEHIDKLNAVGLKWSVHDRSRYQLSVPPCTDATVPNAALSTHVVVSNDNKEIPGSNGVVTSAPVVVSSEKEASNSAPSKVSTSNKAVSSSDSSTNAAVSSSKRVTRSRRKLPCSQSRT